MSIGEDMIQALADDINCYELLTAEKTKAVDWLSVLKQNHPN